MPNLPTRAKRPYKLQPWSREMAIWYACQTAEPSTEQCLEKCAEIGHPIAKGTWYNARSSVEFRALVAELQASGTSLARAKFERLYPEVVDHFLWALQQARAVGDYNAVRALSEMGLDRLLPKKSEGPAVAAQINISLSPERMADMDRPRIPIEAAEIEVLDEDRG